MNPIIPPDYAVATAPKLDVTEFFSNPTVPYLFPTNEPQPTPEISFETMPLYTTKEAFSPYTIDDGSYIHQWLDQISNLFMTYYYNASTMETIDYAELFVNRFISGAILIYSTLDEKINDQPFFPCLEIALRVHLFHKIIAKEQYNVADTFNRFLKFPNDLKEKEEKLLFSFINKDGFFNCYESYPFSRLIHPSILATLETNFLSKIHPLSTPNALNSSEEMLNRALTEWNLHNSQSALAVSLSIRRKVSLVLIQKVIGDFKLQLQKTGEVSKEDFNAAADKIYNILTYQGQCPWNAIEIIIKYQILIGVFDLQECNSTSFQTLESKKNAEIAASPAPSFLSPFNYNSRSQRQRLLENQSATLAWAKSEWEALFNPPPIPAINPPEPVVPNEVPGQEAVVQTSASVPQIDLPPPAPNPVPTVRAQRPPMPLPPAPAALPSPEVQKPEPPRIYANSPNIPIVSYLNITCREAIQKGGEDMALWSSLPRIIQRDALRHCCYLSGYKGAVEKVAARLFPTLFVAKDEIVRLEQNHSLQPANLNLNPVFIKKGEELLNVYYSPNNDIKQCLEQFCSVSIEPLFYQYVFEMAKEAGVHIEDWDHDFAKNNWNKSSMRHLSIQALERCLHTDANRGGLL